MADEVALCAARRENTDRIQLLGILSSFDIMREFMQNRPNSIGTDIDDSSSVAANFSEITAGAQEWLKDTGVKLNNVVINRPALALGAALAAGVFLGWLIKRR